MVFLITGSVAIGACLDFGGIDSATFHGGWVWLHISLCGRVLCMVLVHLHPVVIVIVCHAIATDGGVGGVLDHGLCLAWIHVSVSVPLGWWSGSHCVWIHPMVCLVVSA